MMGTTRLRLGRPQSPANCQEHTIGGRFFDYRRGTGNSPRGGAQVNAAGRAKCQRALVRKSEFDAQKETRPNPTDLILTAFSPPLRRLRTALLPGGEASFPI